MAAEQMPSQRTCRWCGLDADLAPTGKPDGTDRTLEHNGNGVRVACLQALLAEVRILRERVTALEIETGGSRGCVCVGTSDQEDCPHDA